MTDLDYFKARLTPVGKERFDELAGKYEFDAIMTKEEAEQKAFEDLVEASR